MIKNRNQVMEIQVLIPKTPILPILGVWGIFAPYNGAITPCIILLWNLHQKLGTLIAAVSLKTVRFWWMNQQNVRFDKIYNFLLRK